MKKTIIFQSILAVLAITLFTSCEKVKGRGEVITETRTTGTYTSIGLSMEATVYYTQGPAYSLKLSGQENVLHEVLTQVEGNRLVVKVRNGVYLGKHDPITVYVTSPDVSGLEVSGSGNLFADGPWKTGDVSLEVSGSGNISVAGLEAGHLVANISGSGTIKAASGKADREDLAISGSGTIDLRSIESATVYSTTSGSGDTYVFATGMLDATIAGSGSLWYYGTPAVNTHVSGSGSVRKL